MKKKQVFVLIIYGFYLLLSQQAWALQAYVADSFRISLRIGPSLENKILKFIPSGSALEILESSEGWSFVKVIEEGNKSIQGWVLSRYIITRKPWKDQILQLKNKIAKLKEQAVENDKKLKESIIRQQEINIKSIKYESLLREIENEFESLKLRKSNCEKTDYGCKALQKKIRLLEIEKERLLTSFYTEIVIIGACVLFLGIIFGLFIGRKKNKQFY